MAASEQSSSLNPGMADRLLWGRLDGRNGHRRDRPLLGFVTGMRSSDFLGPEAANPRREKRDQSC